VRTNRFTRLAIAAGLPLAGLAALAWASPPPVSKRLVETPTKEAVAKSAPAPAASSPTRADNPTVETGLVKWHNTLEDAQAAAKTSGKPVLLFQMMGYLDKKFC
jgi:hypothetical protein